MNTVSHVSSTFVMGWVQAVSMPLPKEMKMVGPYRNCWPPFQMLRAAIEQSLRVAAAFLLLSNNQPLTAKSVLVIADCPWAPRRLVMPRSASLCLLDQEISFVEMPTRNRFCRGALMASVFMFNPADRIPRPPYSGCHELPPPNHLRRSSS